MTFLSHAVIALVSFVLGGFVDSLIIGYSTKVVAAKADAWRKRALDAEDELAETKAKLEMMSMGVG
jgi:hypothetical protein